MNFKAIIAAVVIIGLGYWAYTAIKAKADETPAETPATSRTARWS